jgi:hypothetical protein
MLGQGNEQCSGRSETWTHNMLSAVLAFRPLDLGLGHGLGLDHVQSMRRGGCRCAV